VIFSLAILNLNIYGSFIKGEQLEAIFLDIKSAYNVCPPILLNMINVLRISLGYKIFFKKLLNYRSIEIYESGVDQAMRSLYKGLLQDSVLSPLLFNFYVKDILINIPYNCKVVQFADNIVIFCQNKFVEKICKV